MNAKLNIKDLNKIQMLISEKSNIEKDIEKLNKIAESVLVDGGLFKKISVDVLIKKDIEERENIFDEDGDLKNISNGDGTINYPPLYSTLCARHSDISKEEKRSIYSFTLPQNGYIEVIAIMIRIKESERSDIISIIKKYGVEL